MSTTDNRPVFLNLLRIRLPVTAVLSILHRISGMAMVLSLPGLVFLLILSLRDQAGFAQVTSLLYSPVAKIVALLFCWVLAHHVLAGIRFMLLDFDVGVERAVARKTAWMVNVCALVAMCIAAGLLFGLIGGVST